MRVATTRVGHQVSTTQRCVGQLMQDRIISKLSEEGVEYTGAQQGARTGKFVKRLVEMCSPRHVSPKLPLTING